MRIKAPAVLALVVAASFAVSVFAVSEHSWWRFWGSLYGSFTTVAVFGLALWGFNRRRGRGAQIGRRLLMGTLTLFGLAVVNWIAMWSFSPFTLEGMWIYPLAIVPLAIVAFMFASRRRSKREGFLWERPPGATQ